MTWCPFASMKPISANFGGHMGQIKGLCIHVAEGNGSLEAYFNDPAVQVSSHFWCSKTGDLEQYLSVPEQTAWAEMAGNPNYVSCETEGYATEPLTDAQITTLAMLLNWCHNQFGVPVFGPVPHGDLGLTQHCNLDGTPDPAWGDHPCPGPIRLAQLPRIVAAASPAAPSPEDYIEMDAVVLANGTIVSHAVGRDGTPIAGHYLEITRKAGTQGQPPQGNVSIIDMTAAYGQFLVQG